MLFDQEHRYALLPDSSQDLQQLIDDNRREPQTQ